MITRRSDSISQLYSLAIVVLIFICSVSALSLPPANLISNNSLTYGSPPDLRSGRPARVPGEPYCVKSVYGTDLILPSCDNAWTKIERSTESKRYVRGHFAGAQPSDFRVPLRYLSDDGRCAIDVELQKFPETGGRYGWDISTGRMISDKAEALLAACVRPKRIGGTVVKFSECKLTLFIVQQSLVVDSRIHNLSF